MSKSVGYRTDGANAYAHPDDAPTALDALPALTGITEPELVLKTQIYVFPLKHLIVMNAAGTLDFDASTAALKLLVANPAFDASSEVLLDLRGVECEMSTTDIFDLAEFMALSNAAFAASKRIAVLVDDHRHGHLPFNKAQFLELCTDNRGLNLRAFEDYKTADMWLNSHLPNDAKHVATMPGPMPPPLTSPSALGLA